MANQAAETVERCVTTGIFVLFTFQGGAVMSRLTSDRVDSKPPPVQIAAARGSPPEPEDAGTGGKPLSKPYPPIWVELAVYFKVLPTKLSMAPWAQGELWNDKVVMHHNMLMTELEKPGGQDVVAVENILKVLVAERYVVQPACHDATPEGAAKIIAERYPNLGTLTVETSPEMSAKARHVSETANAIGARLQDPACRRLLESVAKFWESHVRPEAKVPQAMATDKTPSKGGEKVAVVSAPPQPRRTWATHAGPLDAQTRGFFVKNTTTNSSRATLTTVSAPDSVPKSATVIVSPVSLTEMLRFGNIGWSRPGFTRRDDLRTRSMAVTTTTTSTAPITTTTAIAARGNAPTSTTMPTAKDLRQLAAQNLENPDEVRRLAKQRDLLFEALDLRSYPAIALALESLPADTPLASRFPVRSPDKYKDHYSDVALEYTEIFGPDENLIDYLDWCEIHRHVTLLFNKVLDENPDLTSATSPKVVELCQALSALDETDDEATLRAMANNIHEMVSHRKVKARAIAEQPYASTRMLLQKCTLLQKYAEEPGNAVHLFRQMLKNAHQIRKASHAGLQDELLKERPSDRKVVAMATSAYARAMTIPTVSYIRQGTAQVQLEAMNRTLLDLSNRPIRSLFATRPLNRLEFLALMDVREHVLIQLQQAR